MTPTSGKSPAVFVDRDGTLIRDADYCSDPEQVQLFPGAAEALRQLKARGFFTLDQYRAVEAEVSRQLGDNLIDATYFCPDVPARPSQCCKPAPRMVLQAARDHDVDLTRSFLIGDKEIDAECGRNAGVRTIRVETGFDRDTSGSCADCVAKDLPAAVELILKLTSE